MDGGDGVRLTLRLRDSVGLARDRVADLEEGVGVGLEKVSVRVERECDKLKLGVPRVREWDRV